MHGIGSAIGSDRLLAAAETVHGEDVIAMLFNSAMETPDAAAKPAIIALGAEYLAHGTTIDKFIRGAMRMLVSCDSDDIEMLTKVAGIAGAVASTERYVKMLRTVHTRNSIGVFADQHGGTGTPMAASIVIVDIDTDRLLYLLGSHGLARTTTFDPAHPATASGRSRSDTRRADGLTMTADYARRLARILPTAG